NALLQPDMSCIDALEAVARTTPPRQTLRLARPSRHPRRPAGTPPRRADPAAVRSAQITARRARSDAEASADRLADEPPRPPMTARLAYALTDTARRIAHASLTLDAAVSAPAAADGQPPADRATADGQA